MCFDWLTRISPHNVNISSGTNDGVFTNSFLVESPSFIETADVVFEGRNINPNTYFIIEGSLEHNLDMSVKD